MATSGPIPIVDNPFRQLGISSELVGRFSDTRGNLKDPEMRRIVEAAGKALLAAYHPSQISSKLSDEERPLREAQIQERRAVVQNALELLSVPDEARRAAREYRNLSLQDEVDRVSEFVTERREYLQRTKRVYAEFITSRALLDADKNITKVRSATFQVSDVLSLANFRDSMKRPTTLSERKQLNGLIKNVAPSYVRTIEIDENGIVSGGVPPFFPEEPEKRVVGVLRVEGDELSDRILEDLLRHTGLTIAPPERSIQDYSNGAPTPQPWREFSPVLNDRAIGKLSLVEMSVDDEAVTAKLSVRYTRPSDDSHSYLITASRTPDRYTGLHPHYPKGNRDVFYVEGLIRDFTFAPPAEVKTTPKKRSDERRGAAASKATDGSVTKSTASRTRTSKE